MEIGEGGAAWLAEKAINTPGLYVVYASLRRELGPALTALTTIIPDVRRNRYRIELDNGTTILGIDSAAEEKVRGLNPLAVWRVGQWGDNWEPLKQTLEASCRCSEFYYEGKVSYE